MTAITTKRYGITFSIGEMIVPLKKQREEIEKILDHCREHGEAEVDMGKLEITVVWNVGDLGAGPEDLYDLAEIVRELEANLEMYIAELPLDKPKELS